MNQYPVPVVGFCLYSTPNCLAAVPPPDAIESEEVVDTVIRGKYVQDFDIVRAHGQVIKILLDEKKKLSLLRRDLAALQRGIQHPQTCIARKTSLEAIQEKTREISELESERRLRKYREKAEPLIAAYQRLGPKVKHIVFTGEVPILESKASPEDVDRLIIIDNYLDLASQYVRVDVVRELPITNTCQGCDTPLTNVIIWEDGLQCCPTCGVEKYIPTISNSNKENTKGSTQRNDYDDSNNFLKAFKRYQGLQPNRLPASLYSDLDRYFSSRDMPTGEQVRALPLNERGRRGDTDHKMLYDALSATGYSEFYEDANLIGNIYWGWPLPDVRHLERLIQTDYERTQRVYNTLPKERVSSLGTQYRLFKHLQLRSHPCTKDEFKIAEMQESLELHESTWQKMCEGCNDPYIYFIPTI